MGKYRFRLSDMMPNAWFYKLKDMGKSKSMKPNFRASKTVKPSSSPTKTQTNNTSTFNTNSQQTSQTSAEPLIRFTDPLYSSPRNYTRASDARSSASPSRKSSHVHTRTRNKRTRIYKQNNESCSSGDQPIYYSLSSSELGSPESVSKPSDGCRKNTDFGVELLMFDELGSWSSSSLRSSCSCCCRISSSTADIIIDLNHQHQNQNHEESAAFSRKFQQLNEFDAASELELRPILTKPQAEPTYNKVDSSECFNAGKESHLIGDNNKYVRKLKSRRPSLSDSFAIVKSSIDPQRDFKESMMEMILENNLRGFKDLESLLACYLSLNCKEYHPLIVNAFEQIWLDIFCST